jgi:hypothetical protein
MKGCSQAGSGALTSCGDAIALRFLQNTTAPKPSNTAITNQGNASFKAAASKKAASFAVDKLGKEEAQIIIYEVIYSFLASSPPYFLKMRPQRWGDG